MWLIKESHTAAKQLNRAPEEIEKKYEFWKSIVEIDGPLGLRKIAGFKDHALKGEWQGARSSYLSKQWRVIYVSKEKELQILVLEVNPHDYRKKG